MSDTRNERGVSEVLGVVLMVSITVLLAATAASMFFGFQNELGDSAPTVAVDHEFSVEDGSHVLEVSLVGGDPVSTERLHVFVRGAECVSGGDPLTHLRPGGFGISADTVSAGTTFPVDDHYICRSGGRLDLSEARVELVWIGADGESSQTLWEWRGPAV